MKHFRGRRLSFYVSLSISFYPPPLRLSFSLHTFCTDWPLQIDEMITGFPLDGLEMILFFVETLKLIWSSNSILWVNEKVDGEGTKKWIWKIFFFFPFEMFKYNFMQFEHLKKLNEIGRIDATLTLQLYL